MWSYLAILMVITGIGYCLPQVIRAAKRGNAKGLSIYFLLFWLLDKGLSLAYTIHIADLALIIKYAVGFICISFLLYLKMTVKD